jgi:hypothetical protein
LRQKDRENLLHVSVGSHYDYSKFRSRSQQMGQVLSQNIAQAVEERLSKACLCELSKQAASEPFVCSDLSIYLFR